MLPSGVIIWSVQGICLDREQLQIWFFLLHTSESCSELPSNVRTVPRLAFYQICLTLPGQRVFLFSFLPCYGSGRPGSRTRIHIIFKARTGCRSNGYVSGSFGYYSHQYVKGKMQNLCNFFCNAYNMHGS